MSRNTPLVRWLVSALALAGILFACAGRVNLLMMWAYLGAYCGPGLSGTLIANGSLDAERRQPGSGSIDPASRPAASLLFLATVAVASLDSGRFHWSSASTRPIQCAALMVFVLASAFEVWALSANPFFSAAIRIQSERRHRVMTAGPYHVIRHPGYLAMAITMPTTALALGSLVALIPGFCYSTLILWRTKREDRFLTDQLAGYAEYSIKVRHRLILGLW